MKTSFLKQFLTFCFIIVAFACFANSVSAATFTVNSTLDTQDAFLGDGLCDDGANHCTLRAAIDEANAFSGLDTVNFNIAPGGPQTIIPGYGYNNIIEGITIDGTTQPGYAGSPIIEIDGGFLAYNYTAGLVLLAPNNLIQGLVINNFQVNYAGPGILISGGDYTTVRNCYIGTDLLGMIAKPNNEGIFVDGAHYITIGGSNASDRNIISGNAFHGINIHGNNNHIENNYIGTDVTGNFAVPNNQIMQDIGGVLIAGLSPSIQNNLISGNNGYGLRIVAVTNGVFKKNNIGTNATASTALSNTEQGIKVSPGTSNIMIGGPSLTDRNIISGNGGDGIAMDRWVPYPTNNYGSAIINNTIQKNYIGVDAVGTSAIPNQRHGIYINAADRNLISENIIAHNNVNGIAVANVTGAYAVRDQFTKNSIFQNGQLGIDLGINGITTNDAGDNDSGPNMFQNNPTLKSAGYVGGTTKITGGFNSVSNKPFHVEVYASPTNTAGQGKTYYGTFMMTTNGQGNISPMSITVPSLIPLGQYITVLARDMIKGDTSEFSNPIIVQ